MREIGDTLRFLYCCFYELDGNQPNHRGSNNDKKNHEHSLGDSDLSELCRQSSGARCGYVVGMPLTGMRMERGFAPTTSGAVVSIRTDFPSISAQITTQLKGLS